MTIWFILQKWLLIVAFDEKIVELVKYSDIQYKKNYIIYEQIIHNDI